MLLFAIYLILIQVFGEEQFTESGNTDSVTVTHPLFPEDSKYFSDF